MIDVSIMNKNSEKPKVGKEFEKVVKEWAELYYDCEFESEKPVEIENPCKPHKFDLVSKHGDIVIECKCYTWTESGNVPSAKLATLDEAILYMRSIEYPAKKIIALSYDFCEKKNMTLAKYFCEKKGHLLEDISVWEIKDSENAILIYDGSDISKQ